MRPFLNSIAPMVKEYITLKRLDIEENDFPKGMQVVRGTPTFIEYPGGRRWEEFKPRDFVKRICLDYPVQSDVRDKMYDLVDKVATRFQLFSGLIMWNTESEKILNLVTQNGGLRGHTMGHEEEEEDDKVIFNRYVAEVMAEDMSKCDGLEENLVALNKELNMAEMHAIMMGQIIGEKVLEMDI